MKEETVTVLMSTYNGAKNNWLQQQIETILNQENVIIQLIIRDDGSSDDTLSILHDYSNRYNNVTILESNNNLGACRSFLELI